MGAVIGVINVNGTRLPCSPEGVATSVEQGFLFEALLYESQNALRAAPWRTPRVLGSAREAVRALRVQVRTAHVLGMTPREVERAVEWAESGWVHALGLLNSGTHCGFTVVLGSGAVAEWRVTPVRYLEIRTHATYSPPRTRTSRPELSS
ncbi:MULTISPECIES: hypothetical protein [unclassified Streptomyces]|uniref:hypothetical protein n=1 Tax=unclassified Streptomyces TaxID=2593676 RepID=UPI000AC8565D|nr:MULTISPECIES: hypothetical protein [unclassified Streptomyces]